MQAQAQKKKATAMPFVRGVSTGASVPARFSGHEFAFMRLGPEPAVDEALRRLHPRAAARGEHITRYRTGSPPRQLVVASVATSSGT